METRNVDELSVLLASHTGKSTDKTVDTEYRWNERMDVRIQAIVLSLETGLILSVLNFLVASSELTWVDPMARNNSI